MTEMREIAKAFQTMSGERTRRNPAGPGSPTINGLSGVLHPGGQMSEVSRCCGSYCKKRHSLRGKPEKESPYVWSPDEVGDLSKLFGQVTLDPGATAGVGAKDTCKPDAYRQFIMQGGV